MLKQRREEYRESLREEILDAARQLFVVHGYQSTSIRSIAAKVGASPGILYHYFEDKQDIVAHLIRETFVKLTTRMKSIADDDDEIEPRLRRGLRAYIDFGLQFPHHYALLLMSPEIWDGNPKIIAAFKNEGTQAFNCLRSLSQQAIADGHVRSDIKDPEELAQTMWMAIHGVVSLQIGCEHFPWIERSRLAERLVEILLQGLRKI